MSQSLKWTNREDVDNEVSAGIRLSEMERMLARASFAHSCTEAQLEEIGSEDAKRQQVASLKQQLREQAQTQPLDKLAAMLRIARWLSARTTADLGKELM